MIYKFTVISVRLLSVNVFSTTITFADYHRCDKVDFLIFVRPPPTRVETEGLPPREQCLFEPSPPWLACVLAQSSLKSFWIMKWKSNIYLNRLVSTVLLI